MTHAYSLNHTQVGAGGLPDDVNRAASGTVKGPLVLQVRAMGVVCRNDLVSCM